MSRAALSEAESGQNFFAVSVLYEAHVEDAALALKSVNFLYQLLTGF